MGNFFAIFFTASRNLATSLILTVVATLLLDVFLNAEHPLYLLSSANEHARRRRFLRNWNRVWNRAAADV